MKTLTDFINEAAAPQGIGFAGGVIYDVTAQERDKVMKAAKDVGFQPESYDWDERDGEDTFSVELYMNYLRETGTKEFKAWKNCFSMVGQDTIMNPSFCDCNPDQMAEIRKTWGASNVEEYEEDLCQVFVDIPWSEFEEELDKLISMNK